MLAYTKNHLILTTRLRHSLQRYIEAKNNGIHGFLINHVTLVLSDLTKEILYLEMLIDYLEYRKPKQLPTHVILDTLGYVPQPSDGGLILYREPLSALEAYGENKQSLYYERVKDLLKLLNKE